jgi:hypothetical protein
VKKGPPVKGGPGKSVQIKSLEKDYCANSPLPATIKSRRLPPEILSAVARSPRRPITLARPQAPREAQSTTATPSTKPARLSLDGLRAAARARREAATTSAAKPSSR